MYSAVCNMPLITLIFSLLLPFLLPCNSAAHPLDSIIRPPTHHRHKPKNATTTWAVLVAGSNGFENYRHQADVCHAYQVLKKGGLKDENIIVFMYDDIADDDMNPRKGVVINHPKGPNVYQGVPKDYTGKHVTAKNLYAVILGDKKAVKGGSGKVVDSKPDDRIFIFYSDHGGPGALGMPNGPNVYADDFINVLKKKHKSGTYKEMVIYVEACESGSIFEGLLPDDLNIYVTTASNAVENSWGTYCPDSSPPPPPGYDVCLGDLYSVAWMEDSDSHNRKKETLEQQYVKVKERTSDSNTYNSGSHVMEYGDKNIHFEKLYLYLGSDPNADDLPSNTMNVNQPTEAIHQRNADILSLWERYKKLEDKSKKMEVQKVILDTMLHRKHLDASIDLIGLLLFGPVKAPSYLNNIREPGLPLVDDWICLKSMVRSFETYCGSLTQYGMKHMRAFANICNRGVALAEMEVVTMAACSERVGAKWNPLREGHYSA